MTQPTPVPCWRAGLARVDITPIEPIWLHGWGFRTQPSVGVDCPIYVNALALQDAAGRQGLILGTDLLGFGKELAIEITDALQRELGLKRAQVILNYSHNHSGPALTGLLPLYFDLPAHEQEVIDRYTRALIPRIVQAGREALANLAPAKLSFGVGSAGIAVNRRRHRDDRRLPCVVDQDVPVLRIDSLEGALRGIMFGYACHTTCESTGKVNGDYAGYAQIALRQMFPDVSSVFLAGCGADANPLPRHQPGLGAMYGQILAHAVADVLRHRMTPLDPQLRTAFTLAKLAFDGPPGKAELLALRPDEPGIAQRSLDHLLAQIDRDGSLPATVDYPVQVWQLGADFHLIALTGETVADYAYRFKQRGGFNRTWVAGYCNELLAYIPSRRVRLEGYYEGTDGMHEYALPGPFTPDVEDRIAAAVEGLVG